MIGLLMLLLLEIEACRACAKPGGPIFTSFTMGSFFHIVLGKSFLREYGNTPTGTDLSQNKRSPNFHCICHDNTNKQTLLYCSRNICVGCGGELVELVSKLKCSS